MFGLGISHVVVLIKHIDEVFFCFERVLLKPILFLFDDKYQFLGFDLDGSFTQMGKALRSKVRSDGIKDAHNDNYYKYGFNNFALVRIY